MMYGELSFFHRLERLPDTLQRLDFIVFDLVPTLTLPFYLAYVVLLFGPNAALFLGAIYVLLLWISIFNMALADLSPVPRGLSQMRSILFVLIGNHVRRVAAR